MIDGYDSLVLKDKEKLKEWYDTVKDKICYMKEEMFHYCLTDTEFLSRGC